MIGYLVGRPLVASADNLILNVQGVGYELSCSQSTLGDVEGRDFCELWVHTHVREDVIQLFGFSKPVEKQLFLSLIKVNGIGPKMALTILSATRLENLIRMIEEADAKGLSQLPKVGKKTAEQMILSLQGKLVRTEDEKNLGLFPARGEIVSALVNLGFRLQDVEKVVDQMPSHVDVQQGVRKGLSALTS